MEFDDQQKILRVPEWDRKYVSYETGMAIVTTSLQKLPEAFMRRHHVVFDKVDALNLYITPKTMRAQLPSGKALQLHIADPNDEVHTPFSEEACSIYNDPFLTGSALYDRTVNNRNQPVQVPAPNDTSSEHGEFDSIVTTIHSLNAEMSTWLSQQVTQVERFYIAQSQFMSGRAAQALDEAKRSKSMDRAQLHTLKRSLQDADYAFYLLLSYCTLNFT
eukprot:PhF_6_TR36038/c0_g1_i1/m.52253